MKKKRLKKNKKRGMEKRNNLGKKPLSPEQKEAQKKRSAVDRARTKADLDKKNN
ncbi:hypothetical protein KAI04_03065 [Candidatus Pacearchaeota archaeon]|nr:hypothetical protein [Candidatus Pacearchaeota archaeon]